MKATPLAGLWAVPAALLLHNLEESLTLGAALPRLEAAVVALYVLARVWDRLAYALVVVQAVMTVNVGVHVAFAVLLGGYAPGLLTAVLVEAPASVLVLRQLRRSAWMTRTQWRLLPWLAAFLHGPGLVALLKGAGVRSCL